jgi:molybdate-binding protein/DNA-binding XRE family transcriptional regulator
MDIAKEQLLCNLKATRKTRGLSQNELAQRVGVKRQAIYDIESGRYTPNTTLALRLARELGCRVEDLFVIEESECEKTVTLADSAHAGCTRVSVTKVRDRLVAHPIEGRWMINEGFHAADGFLQPDAESVKMIQPSENMDKKALLLGCDPAFSILGEYVSRYAGDARLQCRFASSFSALEGLAAGHAHIAAAHLHNTEGAESNLELARRIVPGSKLMIIAFSSFEEGLMVAPGNPYGIKTIADLALEGVRFVNREEGAALRILFDECLKKAGIPHDRIMGYNRLVSGHFEGAQLVAFRMVDAALGLRAVAAAYGLDFVPLEMVRCDLVIPYEFQEHPAVSILLDVLQTRAFRTELSALPGYDPASTGKVVADIQP